MKIKRKLFMKSSEHIWEAKAVLNPSVVKDKNGIEHMFYRAVAKDGVSSIGYAKIIKGKIERFDKPVLFPTESYDIKGVEDPRVTKISNIYYMLYTAFNGEDARIAYAVSKNLKDWEKKGIISPNIPVVEARKLVRIKKYRDKWKHQEIYGAHICLWNKDAVLFPEKINGKFVMLHRLLPDIQIVKFKSFSELKNDNFWRKYIENLGKDKDKISLYRRYDWESEHIGAGAVPIKTKRGWLLIYHGVELQDKGFLLNLFNRIYYNVESILGRLENKRLPLIYHAGAVLLDLKRPEIEVARLKEPLFSPKHNWEKEGDISDVVFPEGAVVEGDKLKIYYGCSDSRIGLAELSLKKLLRQIEKDS